MIIKYTGTSDFQEFSKADFDKADVEGGKKVRFAKDEPTEIDDALGQALVSKEGLFGDHSFVEVDEDGEEVDQSKGGSSSSDEPDLGKADSRGDQNDTDTTGGTGGGTTTTRSTAKKAAAGNRSSTRSS
jgi:hypothetical protein